MPDWKAISRRRFVRHGIGISVGSFVVESATFAKGHSKPSPFATVGQILNQAVSEKAFPGCTAAVGDTQTIKWSCATGHLSHRQSTPTTQDTLYDLASLTKVVGTTSVAVRLIGQKKLQLDDRLATWIPEFAKQGDQTQHGIRRQVTIRHLLCHTSGLPAWKPIYQEAASYRETIDRICQTDLVSQPDQKYRYSDLGMMLLGEVLQRAGDARLDSLEERLIWEPLEMTSTIRNPPPRFHARIAPTERIGSGDRFYRGVVHDENARAADGLTGHAGLFSNILDLSKFCQAWLQGVRGQQSIFSGDLAREFASRQKIPGEVQRGLGWQTFSVGRSGGRLLSDSAFGHTGFTGTSLWIDPHKDLFLILLSNRIHPSRKNSRHLAVRREFADASTRAMGSL